MPRLKAATVSDQAVKKRKRKTCEDHGDEGNVVGVALEQTDSTLDDSANTTTTTVPTKTHDGGKKPRRAPKKKEVGKPALVRHASSTIVETTIPWPEHLTKLAQVHRALNLVYTFCCTRKHLATTLDNLKATVEGHIKRELAIEDVAQITALIPKAITFAYVDEAMLQINLMGQEDHIQGRKAQDFVITMPEPDKGEHKEVLLFEFIDGDLKRQVQHAKTGEPTKATQKLRYEDLKMPVFSQKQMMNLIEKRNVKFTSAVNAFLNQCAEEKVDAVVKVKEMSQAFIPTTAESRASTPGPDRALAPSTIPVERKSIPEIVDEIKTLEWYTGQVVPDGHRVFDPQPAIFGDLNFQLSQNMVNALYNTKNITQLYAHQAEAINNLYEGHNVIVSTSTSSGKSLIYQLPVLHQLEQDPDTRAMYIFPTKALAQDQRKSMKELLRFMTGLEEVLVETFDGDTPMSERNYIRDEARIIFTNPDMLHLTILPQEDAWRTFLQNLRFVVVDELHVYNGLFGAHMAFIMRRLRRICATLGNRHVKFISCSATVANPEEHMRTIFGVDEVRLTDFDGSPSGRKEFLCWNTPFKDPGDPTSGRGDCMAETAKLFCQLMLRGVRAIAFCRIRKQCEALLAAVKTELTNLERTEVLARVMSYRGGYTPQDRRQIEREMFDGKLIGIVCTSALELGVDIGTLDAVLTVGFPYTIANLRQQSGRAGRRNKDSLSVLIGDCFPTDQYYMSNPSEIFTKPNCALQVDLENMLVVEGHVQCAAHEIPINVETDTAYFGPLLPKVARERMRRDPQGFYHVNERFLPQPSRFVAIRDTEEDHFAIIDVTNGKNTVLEELEASRAFFTLYDGGIFLHQGNTYLVKEFSQERMLAKVEYIKVDWTTQQRDYTDIDPVETEAIRRIPGSKSRAFYGAIKVKQVVYGFFKIDKKRRILDAVQVDNPPIILFSKGMWLDIPRSALDILKSRRLNIAAGIHAAEHAVLSLMPNFVISMPGDVRTECKFAPKEFAKKETQRKRPARLTFYDAKGGASGSGISTKAFEHVDLLLQQACERLTHCGCLEGCLECCNNDQCKHANQVISKAGGKVVVMCLLGREKDIDIDSLPWGEEDTVPAGIETVVEAQEVRMAGGKRAMIGDGDDDRGGGFKHGAGGAGAGDVPDMARAKMVDGVWVKVEEDEDDHFSRSIDMYRGERTFIGVHKGR
jgi:DEAD/DEAH box helicase domain-containing protein